MLFIVSPRSLQGRHKNYFKMVQKKLPLFISPKDLQRVTGWSIRHCQRIFAETRIMFDKGPRSMITPRDLGKKLKLTEQELLDQFGLE